MFVPACTVSKECGTIVFFTFKVSLPRCCAWRRSTSISQDHFLSLFNWPFICGRNSGRYVFFLATFRDTDAVVLHLYVYMTVIIPCTRIHTCPPLSVYFTAFDNGFSNILSAMSVSILFHLPDIRLTSDWYSSCWLQVRIYRSVRWA